MTTVSTKRRRKAYVRDYGVCSQVLGLLHNCILSLRLIRGVEPICHHGPHELWNIARGQQKLINFILKFYLYLPKEIRGKSHVKERERLLFTLCLSRSFDLTRSCVLTRVTKIVTRAILNVHAGRRFTTLVLYNGKRCESPAVLPLRHFAINESSWFTRSKRKEISQRDTRDSAAKNKNFFRCYVKSSYASSKLRDIANKWEIADKSFSLLSCRSCKRSFTAISCRRLSASTLLKNPVQSRTNTFFSFAFLENGTYWQIWRKSKINAIDVTRSSFTKTSKNFIWFNEVSS